MIVPFSTEQFLDVFRRYNEAVWPAQWGLLALAIGAIVLAFRVGPRAGRAIGGILAVLWLWMGVVYHLTFFRALTSVAIVFGMAFVAQGLLLLWFGVWRDRLRFRVRRDPSGTIGGLLVLYGLVVYPAIGLAIGHHYPTAPTFGLPCPTTIVTLGLFAWAGPSVPRSLLGIPLAWTATGTMAALQLGMWEDLGLLAAAAGLLIVWWTGSHRHAHDRHARDLRAV